LYKHDETGPADVTSAAKKSHRQPNIFGGIAPRYWKHYVSDIALFAPAKLH